MDAQQLTKLLGSHPRSRQFFRGVYARNELPSFPHMMKRSLYIVNTDPSHLPGKHWVTIYFENGRAFYFDSFGLPPLHKDIIFFLRKAVNGYRYSNRTIQHINSVTCGLYALHFAVHISCGYSVQYILNSFDSNGSYNNDNKVKQWFRNVFNVYL